MRLMHTDWDKQYAGCWDVTPRGPGGGAPGKPRVHAGGRCSKVEPCQRHGFLACLLRMRQGVGAGIEVGLMGEKMYECDEAWGWEVMDLLCKVVVR